MLVLVIHDPLETTLLAIHFAREIPIGVESSWSYGSVEPDFLRSTCYYTDEDPVYPA